MADESTNGNGCYLVVGAVKFPIKKSLAEALQALIVKQDNQTGQVLIHVKNGGVSAVELKTVWVE